MGKHNVGRVSQGRGIEDCKQCRLTEIPQCQLVFSFEHLRQQVTFNQCRACICPI